MDQKQNIEQFKEQPRLRKFSVLKPYDLYLKLDLSDSTFSGLVHINLSIVEPTKFVVLNACELVVHQVLFTNSLNHRFTPCDVAFDGDDEILVLVNVEQSGFYRVKYGDELDARMRKAKGFLSAEDKYSILDARYALFVACEQSLASLLSLMDVYRKETDYIVSLELIDAAYIALMGNANRIRDGFQSLLKVYREDNAIQEKERALREVELHRKQFCSNEKVDEVEEFFESRVRPSFAMNLKQSIEQARIKARFV
ncbi:hypothetical protein J1N35_031364 [Gossypium stocksii]|uniref:ERAP1-like C-terminal domain-containing protein n=1 Tax=Gossypium stocksii TaxID=47602 RepID=A0A9D3V1S4_9ROSI|nr:hypothetical protein J1N35_031364 [Gossypium stocksii]